MSLPPTTAFNRLKECRHGQMLFNANDKYVGRSLDLYGEFSVGETDLFRQIIKPGHVVLEIGANIGAHTLFLAQQVGSTGRVLAFEPQRIAFQTLCANMALNSIANTWCFPKAVGAEQGHIVVPLLDPQKTSNFGGLALGNHQQGDRIAVVTIDSLELDRCDAIKIDVEGMEEAVLRGATATLAKFRPVLYVENDRADRSEALIRYIDSLDYAMYWHLPPLFSPNNYFRNAENVFGRIISRNMLCAHRKRQNKIEHFEPVKVPPERREEP